MLLISRQEPIKLRNVFQEIGSMLSVTASLGDVMFKHRWLIVYVYVWIKNVSIIVVYGS